MLSVLCVVYICLIETDECVDWWTGLLLVLFLTLICGSICHLCLFDGSMSMYICIHSNKYSNGMRDWLIDVCTLQSLH